MLVVALLLMSMGCWIGAGLLGLTVHDDRAPLGLGLLGSLLAFSGALAVLLGAPSAALAFRFWGAPAFLEVDALSAAFLLPLHLVAGLALIYGKAYWPLDAAKGSGRWVRIGFGLLVASMNLVFIARQGVLFLVAWEAMAMSAMLLMATEHERPEVMRGTWVYLACTHVGTMLLTAMVILMAQRLGGYGWYECGPFPQPFLDGLILVLAVLGFGFKAGLVPLHFWLPAAHAGSPSHPVRGHAQGGGVRGPARLRPAASGAVPGRRGAGPGRRHRPARGRLRPGPARLQAAAGLFQRREHRHHLHGRGPGLDRAGHGESLDRGPGFRRGHPARVEPRRLQEPAVLRGGQRAARHRDPGHGAHASIASTPSARSAPSPAASAMPGTAR